MRIVSVLADRLNVLYAQWERDNGHALTDQDLASRLSGTEWPMSPVYLAHLRAGLRFRPSHAVLARLARFFDVPVDYLDCADESAPDVRLARTGGGRRSPRDARLPG